MNKPTDPLALDSMKFGVGQPVPRAEDPILVQGQGSYTDDQNLPRQLYAAFVRSQHAHGILRSVDLSAAREMKGVVAVYDAAALASGGYAPLKSAMPLMNRDGSKMDAPPRDILATDRVRFVGECVAFVVAESAAIARDAAEAVTCDIDPLPVVLDPEEALADGAPQLFDKTPNNLVLDYQFGDSDKVDAAVKQASYVARLRLLDNRVVVNPMEPRAAIGEWDAKGERFVLHVPSQGVFGMRAALAGLLKVPAEQVRVLTGHVGGSFGMKSSVFPEYICLLHAARDLKRPVKWTDARSESFVSDHHGRDMIFDAELALDASGKFLAMRITGLGNMGAYPTGPGPLMPTGILTRNLNGMYRMPLVELRTKSVVTNTVPVGAYRGAGRPEGNYIVERLIEEAARIMGVDAIKLRKKNHVLPKHMPYKTAVGTTFDSGEFSALLDRAVEASDWKGFAKRKRDSAKKGLLRGRGVGAYLEVTAPPQAEMGGIHFEQDGTVTIVTGTLDYGQGHWTPFAQVLVTELGVPFDKIRLHQGDSDRLIAGGGTGGSKSIMASGAAIMEASALVVEKGRKIAGHVLEAAPADIEFESGRFSVAGTDRGVGIMELAQKLRDGLKLPADLPQTLDVDHVHELSPAAYPNGCHIAEVEIDPQTGVVRVDRYTMVNDFGTVVNPLLVEGQVHGGVIQGVGQALMERVVYDADGQIQTGSFMDYAMPRADEIPAFHYENRSVPAKTNPLGAKGCGEAGCAGALPSVMNAIVDALSAHGITQFDMPATPHRVWKALQEVKARNAA